MRWKAVTDKPRRYWTLLPLAFVLLGLFLAARYYLRVELPSASASDGIIHKLPCGEKPGERIMSQRKRA